MVSTWVLSSAWQVCSRTLPLQHQLASAGVQVALKPHSALCVVPWALVFSCLNHWHPGGCDSFLWLSLLCPEPAGPGLLGCCADINAAITIPSAGHCLGCCVPLLLLPSYNSVSIASHLFSCLQVFPSWVLVAYGEACAFPGPLEGAVSPHLSLVFGPCHALSPSAPKVLFTLGLANM